VGLGGTFVELKRLKSADRSPHQEDEKAEREQQPRGISTRICCHYMTRLFVS